MSSERESSVALFEIGEVLDERVFADYLAVLDSRIEAGQPFAMVVDASSPGIALTCRPNPRWQLQRAEPLGRLHRGIAFVTGTVTRERMQAFNALQGPGVPYALLATREEALAWAQSAIDGERKAAISERKTVPFMPAIR